MKIALIAMNGVKANDPELMQLGFSLPGFIERGKAIASLPSLALLTLAGLTPSRHHLSYIEVPNLEDMKRLPADFDLVAISSYSAQILDAYKLARSYRALGIPVVIGGPHVSCLPEEAAQFCDAVAIGEGEPIWLEILDDCDNRCLKKFYGSRFSSFELSSAPMPAFELLEPDKYNRLTVQTSRGCPHRCEFCAASILISKKYKQKPKEKVLAEIDNIKSIWHRPFIEFADDNSLVDRGYWKDLLPELAKRKVAWFAETDISVADDPELLKMMRESGCAEVLIGLESPTVRGMDGLETRANWKLKTWSRYKQSVQEIQSRGIRVIGCFILGLDGHSSTDIELLPEFIDDLGLFDVQITVQTAFPGTPLYARLKAEDRLIEQTNWNMCTLFDVNFRPADMTASDLTNGFRHLAGLLYTEDETRKRRSAYKKAARMGRNGQCELTQGLAS